MVYDWSGFEGAFAFSDFSDVVTCGGVVFVPFPTVPDKHSKEDQEDTDDDASGDSPNRASAQPTNFFGSDTIERVGFLVLRRRGRAWGQVIMGPTNDKRTCQFLAGGVAERDARRRPTNDSTVNAKPLTCAELWIDYPSLVTEFRSKFTVLM